MFFIEENISGAFVGKDFRYRIESVEVNQKKKTLRHGFRDKMSRN